MTDKILIVDDDLETLRLVGLMLQKQGFQVLAASSGNQALLLAEKEKPDLILLDILMPEMDGYEVVRKLRHNPETAQIAVVMFTAKNKPEDQTSGYGVGADDYLTKPIRSAEMVAHIKALLERKRAETAANRRPAHIIGCLAAKGGVGVSTLALNMALALHKQTNSEIVAVELRPGQGSWGVELGYPGGGLSRLLSLKPEQIDLQTVKKEITQTPFGISLLLTANQINECDPVHAAEQIDKVLREVSRLVDFVVIDIGNIVFSFLEKTLHHCNQLVVVTEPMPATVQRTQILTENLSGYGFGKRKPITIVSCTRSQGSVGMTISHIQEQLRQPVALSIPSAPEAAYHSTLRMVPLAVLQPDSAATLQYKQLAEVVMRNAQ